MSYQRSLGSSQSRPSNFVRLHRGVAMGSSQSRPSNFVRMSRGGMGASAIEYSLVSGLVDLIRSVIPQKVTVQAAPARKPMRQPMRPMHGFGSLGDETDAEPPTSLAQPTLAAPTIVDPAATAAWQQAMLEQTQLMVASQQDYAQREVQQKWIQIGATLAIPLAAAGWRALGRALSGRRAARDYE